MGADEHASTQAVETASGARQIGDIIDSRYRITGMLGRGGMGTVYRAEHVAIRRPVALKLLHPELGDRPDFGRRFEREALATGRVDHPNCVTVSDFGRLPDGTLYLVMQLLAGRSLGEVLEEERRIEVRRALGIARHLLRGLAHAHRAGVVHRDLKPENVFLVEQDGDPDFAKLLDFGIAKLVGEAATEAEQEKLTQVGMAIGTPTYMSPEQAFGDAVDPRSDLYSVSVMLYEMIAGCPPFSGPDKLAVLTMHAGRAVPPFRETAPDLAVPPAVEALVMRGLAKKRDQRFATADEYLGALDAVQAELDARSGAAGQPPPPPSLAGGTAERAASGIGFADTSAAMATPSPGAAPFAPTTGPAGTALVAAAPRPRRTLAWVIGGAIIVAAIAAFGLGGRRAAPGIVPDVAAQIQEYSELLKSGKTCEERRDAVARLRALNDKRAIPALKKARFRMRGGVLGIGDSNSNGCLREDAEDAIAYLEAL
jgi:serine/threonine-protein kinase